MALAQNLSYLMEQHHVSTAQLARDLAVSEDTVVSWLNGSSEPGIAHLSGLKYLFSVTMEELLREQNTENTEHYIIPFQADNSKYIWREFKKIPLCGLLVSFITGFVLVTVLHFTALPFRSTAALYFPLIPVLIRLIRGYLSLRKDYRDIEERRYVPGQWTSLSCSDVLVVTEKWREGALVDRTQCEKEELMDVISTPSHEILCSNSRIYGVPKAIIPPDSCLHSFLSEQKKLAARFPRILYVIMQLLTTASLLLILADFLILVSGIQPLFLPIWVFALIFALGYLSLALFSRRGCKLYHSQLFSPLFFLTALTAMLIAFLV